MSNHIPNISRVFTKKTNQKEQNVNDETKKEGKK